MQNQKQRHGSPVENSRACISWFFRATPGQLRKCLRNRWLPPRSARLWLVIGSQGGFKVGFQQPESRLPCCPAVLWRLYGWPWTSGLRRKLPVARIFRAAGPRLRCTPGCWVGIEVVSIHLLPERIGSVWYEGSQVFPWLVFHRSVFGFAGENNFCLGTGSFALRMRLHARTGCAKRKSRAGTAGRSCNSGAGCARRFSSYGQAR